MKKFLIIAGIAVAVLVVLGAVTSYFVKKHTKSFSPEANETFTQGDLTVKVFYNRPFKKGRKIFGELFPYGQVWRTGANEATSFETNKDLEFENQVLKKGKYSLWTIPDKETWVIIFNSEYGQWGIGPSGEANRDPARDVLTLTVRAVEQDREFEQFTINFKSIGDDIEMVLFWDKTLVAVPFWIQSK